MSTINMVSVNTLAGEWTQVCEGILVELTPISDGIVNGDTPTTGPVCVAATGDGLHVICERPYGTQAYRIVLTGDEPTIEKVAS